MAVSIAAAVGDRPLVAWRMLLEVLGNRSGRLLRMMFLMRRVGLVSLAGLPGHLHPWERGWAKAAEASLFQFEVHKMALCVAYFFWLKCYCLCCTAITNTLIPPWWAAALLVCRWGWRGVGSGGQGTGFRAAATGLAKALGVTHCSLPYWLFLWFSHCFLVVVSFRLMEGLCSVWN